MEAALAEDLIALFKYFHQYPELSQEEYNTTAVLKEWLENNNIEIMDLPLKTGLVATIKGANPGPTIAIRADIDALPIVEETALPYASQVPNTMHACGHDFHMTSILGAALLLQQQREALNGNVRIIFQAAEENGGGASDIVKAGGLKDVAAIFGMHNKPDLPLGTVGLKAGGLMAAVDHFIIKIEGIGGHAGIPEKSIDAIVIAANFVTALQSIVSRNISAAHQTVVSVTRISGGNTWNVIPNEVTIEGTVRTFQEEDRIFVKHRMQEILAGFELSYQIQTKLDYRHYLHVLTNDAQFTALFERVAMQENLLVEEAQAVPAGEDFSYYLQQTRGYFIWFGSDGPYDWHHSKFQVNPQGIPLAANYFAALAKEFLIAEKNIATVG